MGQDSHIVKLLREERERLRAIVETDNRRLSELRSEENRVEANVRRIKDEIARADAALTALTKESQ